MSWLLWTQESGVKVKQSETLAEPHFNIFLESGGYRGSSSATAPSSKAVKCPNHLSLGSLSESRGLSSASWRCLWGIQTVLLQCLYWMETWVITFRDWYLYIDYHISGQPCVGICFGEQTLLKTEPSLNWRVFLVRAWRYVYFLEVFWIGLFDHCCHGSQVHHRRQHRNLQRFNCSYDCPLCSVWNS